MNDTKLIAAMRTLLDAHVEPEHPHRRATDPTGPHRRATDHEVPDWEPMRAADNLAWIETLDAVIPDTINAIVPTEVAEYIHKLQDERDKYRGLLRTANNEYLVADLALDVANGALEAALEDQARTRNELHELEATIAAWRPRLVLTVADLDAMPDGASVIDSDKDTWIKRRGVWSVDGLWPETATELSFCSITEYVDRTSLQLHDQWGPITVGAPTPTPTPTGLLTEAELNAMLTGTIITDCYGQRWTKNGHNSWHLTGQGCPKPCCSTPTKTLTNMFRPARPTTPPAAPAALTAADLDAMDEGATIQDRDRDTWTKISNGHWRDHRGVGAVIASWLIDEYSPIRRTTPPTSPAAPAPLTVADLDAIPEGTTVYDCGGDTWTKKSWTWTYRGLSVSTAELIDEYGPIRRTP